MDKFSCHTPDGAELASSSGMKNGMGDVEIARANKDNYGLSRDEMEKGFSSTPFAEVEQTMQDPVGRIPTQRIDA